MKKLLSIFAVMAVFLAAASRGQSQDISVNFFYDNLDGGSWIEVGDYGYCWQPDVAVNDQTWRPYADGYWAYTDDGWTWISYEDFGWATYHYGRWVKLADYGWVWKPGYEWGPAWVSWRTGGNYIGWAPLPPETEYVYESRPLAGHLDIEFDIGPAYYNFCDVRYIGEPVLRSRLIPYQQNVTYVTQTVNVTNITYKNKTVYNYGPDINVVNQYSSRPIQKLKLERQASFDSAAAKSGGLTKVQGNALVVAAPAQISKPAKEIAPPRVKTKVAQPKVEKGWSVAGDPNAQTELKEKLKSEDLKTIPPPTIGAPANTSARKTAGPQAAGMSPDQGVATSPFVKGKGKNKNKADQVQNAAAVGPAGSPLTSPEFSERGKKKKQKNEQMVQPTNAAVTGGAAEMSPNEMPDSGKPVKPGKARRTEQFGGNSPSTEAATATSPEGMTAPEGKAKRKEFERQNAVSGETGATNSGENMNEFRGKNKRFQQQQPQRPTTSPAGQPNGYAAPSGGAMPQSISDQPASGMKNKRFERQPGPPPSSETGAPGATSNATMAPQGGPAGGEERGRRRFEPAGTPAAGQSISGQQGGGPQHEGKRKNPESPAPTPQ